MPASAQIKPFYQPITAYFRKVNWMLLLFLVLVLNVKMVVKLAAIVVLVILNREMFRDKAIYRQRFIWFYAAMIVLALVNLGLSVFTAPANYFIAFSAGVLFWAICIGAAFLNFWFVKTRALDELHATVSLFFLLNIVVTAGQLLLIIWNAGSLNPYTFRGMHQYYFMGTGDYLTGITFDISTTNALLNGFGIFYFLQRGKTAMVWLCMAALLSTASNFSTLLVIAVLMLFFVVRSTRYQKSVILVCWLLATIFMLKVSPQNDHYITDTYKKFTMKKKVNSAEVKDSMPLKQRPDSAISSDEKRQKIAMLYLDSLNIARRKSRAIAGVLSVPLVKPSIPGPDLHADINQTQLDTSSVQKNLLAFAIERLPGLDPGLRQVKASNRPGKLVAFQQTIHFLAHHPSKIITGSGMGNFASKLAFRTTALQIAGGYPQKLMYINNDFLENHLSLYIAYFSKEKELHSVTNSPNAVYDQLLAEYGFAGLLAFVLLYLRFFLRRSKKLTYGLPLLLVILGAFFIDYWYEQLSVVILFELMMLINMKESNSNA